MYKFFKKEDGTHWLNIGEKVLEIETKKQVEDVIYKLLMGGLGLDESTTKELHKELIGILRTF